MKKYLSLHLHFNTEIEQRCLNYIAFLCVDHKFMEFNHILLYIYFTPYISIFK